MSISQHCSRAQLDPLLIYVFLEETPDATEKLVFVEPGSINRAQNQGSLNPLTLCTVESQVCLLGLPYFMVVFFESVDIIRTCTNNY